MRSLNEIHHERRAALLSWIHWVKSGTRSFGKAGVNLSFVIFAQTRRSAESAKDAHAVLWSHFEREADKTNWEIRSVGFWRSGFDWRLFLLLGVVGWSLAERRPRPAGPRHAVRHRPTTTDRHRRDCYFDSGNSVGLVDSAASRRSTGWLRRSRKATFPGLFSNFNPKLMLLHAEKNCKENVFLISLINYVLL